MSLKKILCLAFFLSFSSMLSASSVLELVGIQFVKFDIRLMHSGIDDRIDILKMFTCSKFWDNAAISCMQGNLGGYDGRQDGVAVFDDGCGGFVAAAFDTENYHDG